MLKDAPGLRRPAIRTDLGAIFVSMELSRRAWLITSLSPGAGNKMSKHSVPASDVPGLLRRFAELKRKAAVRTGRDFSIIVIQEAGLDGFWIHRVLQSEGIESHVVDAASILTSRRRRRAKTDRIDGETLVRTPMAFKRGEPRVCSMARAPTPQEEDRRRVCRERRTLVGERVKHATGSTGCSSPRECSATSRCATATRRSRLLAWIVRWLALRGDHSRPRSAALSRAVASFPSVQHAREPLPRVAASIPDDRTCRCTIVVLGDDWWRQNAMTHQDKRRAHRAGVKGCAGQAGRASGAPR